MGEFTDSFGFWIDGRKVAATGGERLPVVNPYTLQTWGSLGIASAEEVDLAVASAARCFRTVWQKVNGYQRGRLLCRLADLLDERAEYFAELESRNNGKLYKETLAQMRFCARSYHYYGGYADKIEGRCIPLDNPAVIDFSLPQPFGVVALITAWNSPMALLANKLAPALAAGNCAVVKPSEFASVTTLKFAELITEAGFPAGAVNVVTGAAATGAALVGHPAVRKLSFTGGSGGGRGVMELAARRQIPVTLELGGKSPNIIFEDAHLPRAINGAIAGVFAAGGQTCIAGSRLLVHRNVYGQVVDALARRSANIALGDPMKAETQMGPVANKPQFDRLAALIAEARAQGATMVAGPGLSGRSVPDSGYFIPPTIFAGVSSEMTITKTEAFGPLLAILPFDSEEEAIEIANGTEFGLAAGIWTRDVARAHRVAARMECGNVWVNTYRMGAVQAPFGGTKGSGFGRERGIEGLMSYMTVRNVMINTAETEDDPFSIRT
jgi:aldehyde dehydrogenase (NAD+)